MSRTTRQRYKTTRREILVTPGLGKLAKKLGVSVRYLRMIRSGERRADRLRAKMEYLGIECREYKDC